MQNTRALAILAAAALLLSLPILLFGYPILGHDARSHMVWLREFSAQFWAGELYPRWLMGAQHGFGSPAFFVYGPVPFFFASLLAPVAAWFHKPAGYIELAMSALVALWVSGLTAYLWLRRSCTAAAASAGALVYLLNPYHVTVDLYMRAALAEFWAFAWMPLILYFCEGTVRRRRYAGVGLAVSYALLVATHLLTTLIFSPVVIAYAWFLARRGERPVGLMRTLAPLALGGGLAAIYLAPAREHERLVSLERLMHTHAYWSENFPAFGQRLLERTGPWPSFVQFIGIVVIVSGVAVVLLALMARGGTRAFWATVAGVCLFQTLPISAPVWRITAPVLGHMQFPWRFLAVAAVAMAALAASAWGARWTRIPAIGMLGIALLWSAFFGRMFYIICIQDHGIGWESTYTDDALLPGWVSRGATEVPMERVKLEGGHGSATVERWRPRDIRVRLRCERESRIVFHQFYYPGWKANTPGPVEATETGQIRVAAPAGDYELRLWLDGGRMERLGRWISAVAAVWLMVWGWLESRRKEEGASSVG